MAAVVFRRGKWLVDYRDKNGTRRWLAVEGGREQAETELKRLGDAGDLYVPTKRRTRREVLRDQQLEEASRTKPTAGRQHHNHGLTTIDETTEVGQSLMVWRGELLQDLGGQDVLSTQELYVVDLICRLRLMVDSIDAWLLAQPTLVNKQRKQVFAAVRERTHMADSVVKNLEMLGLKRRSREVRLADYLRKGEPTTTTNG